MVGEGGISTSDLVKTRGMSAGSVSRRYDTLLCAPGPCLCCGRTPLPGPPMKIDLVSPESFADGHPHAQYRWLRENAPVFWHEEPEGPGFWAVTRHKDVYAVDRDFQAYSSEPTIMITDPAPGQEAMFGDHKMMLMMDPPMHTAYRRLIRGEFTVPVSAERTPRMRGLARQIVDAVIEKGECDFVEDIAGEMPSYVIAELMGLPLEDGRELYKLTEILHTAPESAGARRADRRHDEDVRICARRHRREACASRRRSGHQAPYRRNRRQAPRRHRFSPLLPLADRCRRRHHAQSSRLGTCGFARTPRSTGLAEGRSRCPPAGCARGAAALDDAGHLYAAHRQARHGAGGAGDPARPEGRDVFRRGQSRSGEIRRSRYIRSWPHAERTHRLRHRPAWLPRPASGPHRDRCRAARSADAAGRIWRSSAVRIGYRPTSSPARAICPCASGQDEGWFRDASSPAA